VQESELHKQIAARARLQHAAQYAGQSSEQASESGAGSIELGPGDDCAVVRYGGSQLLLTVDHLIEGRHFAGPWCAHTGSAGGTTADLVARKAIARSVSDIAAMAGQPHWALATAAFAPGTSQADADALCEALFRWANTFGCPLVGGDIASLASTKLHAHSSVLPLVLTVTIGGLAHPRRGPVLRSGAVPGDLVCITGRLGDSLASGRHLSFTPRVKEAAALADALGPRLHAMMDISDGLGRDGARLARASKVRLHIDAASLPLHVPVDANRRAAATWKDLICDGEDYELLMTLDPTAEGEIKTLAAHLGCDLTIIGRVGKAATGKPDCAAVWNGEEIPLDDLGWEHAAGRGDPL